MPPKTAIPAEFEDLLTPAGKRVLAGNAPDVCGALADPRRRFVALNGMIAPTKAERLRRVLERELAGLLSELNQPIPPETIWDMTRNYDDWLPKSVRCRTAYLENRRGAAWQRANELGLIDLLSSPSMIAFAEAVLGRKLNPKGGQQILRYGPSDYAGPHTDHTPQIKRAAKGYLDFHLSLVGPGVAHQYLVYAKAGHFTEMVSVAESGCLTLYRLPFWHYTTPLQTEPKQETKAARWVLLGTFLFAQS
ncbi:hypothetical protein [Dongia deserti]|uniref:hypothetical protein n=1 Tax=Dongia deserti TaxID=2268030 RepID=UPI000E657FC4|nr:hypothetical protein [Dongia deserti]